MKCPYCGHALPGETGVCPACGRELNVRLQSEAEHVGPLGTSRPVLIWGILATALGCLPFVCVLGVSFGLVGLRKAAAHVRFTGSLYGPARAGKILSIVGIALGGAVTALTLLWAARLLWGWPVLPR